MYNINNLVSFEKTDTKWIMKFRKKYTVGLWFWKKTVTREHIVLGGVYTSSYRNGEPCFRHVCYDDPANPSVAINGEIHTVISELKEQEALGAVYDLHSAVYDLHSAMQIGE